MLQVYTYVGGKVFIDFDYELSINTLEDSEKMPCNADRDFTFDDTVYEIANSELEKEHNCTIPFLPKIPSNIRGDPSEICKVEETGRNALKLYQNIESNALENVPCARMDISLGLPFITNDSAAPGGSVPYQGYGSDDTAFILLYFKTSVKVKRTIFDYDFLTLVAELGGYTGLLIGISLVESTIGIICIIEKFSANHFIARIN